MELDQDVVKLAKAIRQVESGGNYNAKSKDGSFGAYQFIKPTWEATARKFGVAASWDKATPEQQNELAYKQIKEWKDKGFNIGEIASMWNAGAGRPDAYKQGLKGTNTSGINFNVAQYATKVANIYHQIQQGLPPQVAQASNGNEQVSKEKNPTILNVFQPLSKDKDFSGIGSSVANFGKDILQGFYLGLGGQKNIDKVSQQYLDNGDKLFQIAQKTTDPARKKQLLEQAQGMYDDVKNVDNDVMGKVRTNKQIIADALGTLGYATIAGTPTVLGGKILPATSKIGKAIGASKAVSTIPGRVLTNTAFGIGEGTQISLNNNDSVGNIAKNAAIGGSAGLAFGGVVEGIGKVVSKIPETAWSSILKRVPTSVAKNPNLEKQIAQEGIIGVSRPKISQTFGKEIQNIELAIADELKGNKMSVPTKNVIGYLNELKSTYANIPGEESSVRAIDNIASEVLKKGKNLSVGVANQLKRDIYGVISKSYGKGLLEVPAKTEAQKMIAYGLKSEIEKLVPEIKDLNARQAIFIQAKKAIDKTIARQTGKGIAGTGIGLYHILSSLGGVTAGALGHGTSGALIGGLGVLGAEKIVESPLFLSSISKGSTKLLDLFNKASPTQKIMLYNALTQISKTK